MAFASRINRPLVLLWTPDLHCNCSFTSMFASPLPFALCESEVDSARLATRAFQVYNYMRPEPGAVKDEYVVPDHRHLFFKSAFLMNHPYGHPRFAIAQLQMLRPVKEVADLLVANRRTVGLHIRNVFDAPRDSTTINSTTGAEALQGATKEYGSEGTRQLLRWRRAGHWTNFVPKIREMIASEDAAVAAQSSGGGGTSPPRARSSIGESGPGGSPHNRTRPPPLRFYLAADSGEAYDRLGLLFSDRLLATRRTCRSARCDFRDCDGMRYSLVDMLNLARTKLILGSGWSSYSEVAAMWGGTMGEDGMEALPMQMAGRDFGTIMPDEPEVDSSVRLEPTPYNAEHGHIQ
uniref:Peptide-O-fucosyltransferase 1 n=1 Tax=Haptolina ericina TaxID=156174 RepID=A0A7S3EWA1_9EUKA